MQELQEQAASDGMKIAQHAHEHQPKTSEKENMFRKKVLELETKVLGLQDAKYEQDENHK